MYRGLDGRVFRRVFTVSTISWLCLLFLLRLGAIPLWGEEAHPFPKAVQALPNAQELYQKAVGGDLKAQSLLGDYCYSVGAWAEAASWYRLAAEKGHVPSAISLANAYKDGRGVAPDLKEAERWLRLARNQKGTGTVTQSPRPHPSSNSIPSDPSDQAQPLAKEQNAPKPTLPTKKRVPVTQTEVSGFTCSNRYKELVYNMLCTTDWRATVQPAFEPSGAAVAHMDPVPDLVSVDK